MNKLTSPGKEREFYEENFKPEDYIEAISAPTEKSEPFYEEAQFLFRSMDNIFRDPAVRGRTLLDIGSGPTVHNLIPACLYYSDIVVSEFVTKSRLAIEKWLRNEPDALDWSTNIKTAVAVHGFKDLDEGRNKVEALIRKNVQAVVHCDVLADRVLPAEYHVPYDLVMSSLTLESACPDYAAFCQSLKKINPLVKLGGFLVLKGFFNGDSWPCGDSVFPYLKVTFRDVEGALKDAGFGKLEWQIKEKWGEQTVYDFDYAYCVRATKVKDCTI